MGSVGLTLLALLPALYAADIGEPGRRFGVGLHAGVGADVTAKLYVTDRVAISAQAGFWGLLIRRTSLMAEVDVWTLRLDSGTVVTTAGLGVARENDSFWRGEAHGGLRLGTGAVWRWHDHGWEVGAELGLELYNYDLVRLQFGELPTATIILRWYPGFRS